MTAFCASLSSFLAHFSRTYLERMNAARGFASDLIAIDAASGAPLEIDIEGDERPEARYYPSAFCSGGIRLECSWHSVAAL